MKVVPRYTKVMNLGNSGTERALIGEVIIQEKIDGSNFRFGLNENHDLVMGSRSVNFVYSQWQKMFDEGCKYILSIEDTIKKIFGSDTYFYAEYLQKKKHNVLAYDRVPKGHLILFDVLSKGKWITDRTILEMVAKDLGIDVVPELYRGVIDMKEVQVGLQFLKDMVDQTTSILGGTTVEGVVIKNYNEWINVGGIIFPVFTKYVHEKYKEKHDKDWKTKSSKSSLGLYFQSFNNENRWEKAIQHLKESGELENSVKDIGALLKEIKEDIKTEEADDIKKVLFDHFIRELLSKAIKGFPEWYKEYLINKNLVVK